MVAVRKQTAATVERSCEMENGNGLRGTRGTAECLRRHRLRRLAEKTATGTGIDVAVMTGLEDRLRKVAGVTEIIVELGDEGPRGIRVRLTEGAQEGDVLEEIRRILVAYGLKATGRRGHNASSIPSLELGADSSSSEPESSVHAVVRPPDEPGRTHQPRPTAVIAPINGRLVAKLTDGYRTVEATAEATPLGASEAMIRALAEWRGSRIPSRIAVDRLDIDDADVVVLVARRDDTVVSAASVVSDDLAGALADAASSILDLLDD